jgi:hypothetical protein
MISPDTTASRQNVEQKSNIQPRHLLRPGQMLRKCQFQTMFQSAADVPWSGSETHQPGLEAD